MIARGVMGTQSAGAYLRSLREKRGLSLEEVGRALQTSKSQVQRIERGQGETRTTLFLGYARLVGANVRHAIGLLFDDPASEATFWDDFDRLTPKQQDAVLEIMRQMIGDE
jgi:transcriptional regulator with XRE-family HTH domain